MFAFSVEIGGKVTFNTKPEIALEQIRAACAAGVPRGTALLDASYGSNSALRTGISALGLEYVAAIISTIKVRRASKGRVSERRLSVKESARKLPKHAWRTITWREGDERPAALALCPRSGAHCANVGRRRTRRRNAVDRMASWRACANEVLALYCR